MSLRTLADFADPNKIKDPTQPMPKSLTGYEMYLKKALQKIKTKGLFQNDPGRLVAKHPGQH